MTHRVRVTFDLVVEGALSEEEAESFVTEWGEEVWDNLGAYTAYNYPFVVIGDWTKFYVESLEGIDNSVRR